MRVNAIPAASHEDWLCPRAAPRPCQKDRLPPAYRHSQASSSNKRHRDLLGQAAIAESLRGIRCQGSARHKLSNRHSEHPTLPLNNFSLQSIEADLFHLHRGKRPVRRPPAHAHQGTLVQLGVSPQGFCPEPGRCSSSPGESGSWGATEIRTVRFLFILSRQLLVFGSTVPSHKDHEML